MNRPGVMAPPTLYDEPPCLALMSPVAQAPPPGLSLNAVLWSVAGVLATVELFADLTP
jgi:hypothetical protein